MHFPRFLLDRPPEETARLIALTFLDQAVQARPRLDNPNDPEALHDFRVALRRLRSALRAYRKQVRPGVNDALLRDLRRAADATRTSRDLEVHREWALQQVGDLQPRQRVGVEWLVARFDARKKKSDRRLMKTVRRDFPALERRFRRRLSRYRTTIRLDRLVTGHTAAVVIGRQVQRLALRLERHLGEIQRAADQDAIHDARIAAKRLRYALEPLEGQVDGVEPLVAQLKGLQDVFGDLHDTQVFQEELRELTDRPPPARRAPAPAPAPGALDPSAGTDPRPGLLALSRLLRRRGLGAFERARAEWLHGADPFFAAVAELADRLVRHGGRSREIERKYLLSAMPPAAHVAPALDIEQGWLPGSRIAERLRRVRATEGEARYRTIKAGIGIDRLEIEEELGGALFEQLWPLTEGRRVLKKRYRVEDHRQGLTWEIDRFTDRDLVLAEVELPAADTAVDPPEWLRPYLVREVTGEDAYVNLNLAR